MCAQNIWEIIESNLISKRRSVSYVPCYLFFVVILPLSVAYLITLRFCFQSGQIKNFSDSFFTLFFSFVTACQCFILKTDRTLVLDMPPQLVLPPKVPPQGFSQDMCSLFSWPELQAANDLWWKNVKPIVGCSSDRKLGRFLFQFKKERCSQKAFLFVFILMNKNSKRVAIATWDPC